MRRTYAKRAASSVPAHSRHVDTVTISFLGSAPVVEFGSGHDPGKCLHDRRRIIHEELQADDLVLTPQTPLQEIEGWDSVSSSCAIIAIENHFGFKFAGGVIERLTSVQSLVDVVERHQASGRAGPACFTCVCFTCQVRSL